MTRRDFPPRFTWASKFKPGPTYSPFPGEPFGDILDLAHVSIDAQDSSVSVDYEALDQLQGDWSPNFPNLTMTEGREAQARLASVGAELEALDEEIGATLTDRSLNWEPQKREPKVKPKERPKVKPKEPPRPQPKKLLFGHLGVGRHFRYERDLFRVIEAINPDDPEKPGLAINLKTEEVFQVHAQEELDRGWRWKNRSLLKRERDVLVW